MRTWSGKTSGNARNRPAGTAPWTEHETAPWTERETAPWTERETAPWSARSTATGNARRRARRRRPTRARARARVIVPVAVPMALGLTLGLIVAQSGGSTTRLTAAPAAASGTPGATPGATLSGTPSASPSAAQDGTIAQNMDCELIVPARPLTAAGLATPYQLTGPGGQDPAASGCTQANPALQAFVQATILDPATGRLAVYEPLVITAGTIPAVAPVKPRLPKNAVVNIMVGFNGNNLKLDGARPGTLSGAKCVNGLGDSLFGQVSYCHSVAFYAAADRDIANGKLRIPAAGRSPLTGQACPTSRSFQIADQDPSDNVTSRYLLTATGRTAQDSTANAQTLGAGAQPISNGSDNTLLDSFVLPALGCTVFTAPDLSDAGRPGTSQTLDELSAAANQRAPVALVPENDPMTMVNGAVSRPKTNLYRLGVGQPLVSGVFHEPFGDQRAGGQQADTPANFCANLLNVQTAFIAANQQRFSASPSPVPATGNNLFTFLAARLSASFTNLGCQAFGLHNTVSVGMDANGVAVAAAFSLVPQAPGQQAGAGQPAPTAQPTPSPQHVIPADLPAGWTPWTPWGDNGDPGY